MKKTLTEVVRKSAELPAPERLKLAPIMLELAEPETEPLSDVQNAWDIEIERRLQELRSGKVEGVPLAEVKEKIEGRLRS